MLQLRRRKRDPHQPALQQHGAPSFYEHASVGYWQVFSLTSFALSLLMVFRTNSSYARWWEARTVRRLAAAFDCHQ